MHTETNASVCILFAREFPPPETGNGKRSTGDMCEVSWKREAIVVRETSVGRNPSEKRKTGMKREASEKYETSAGRVQRMKRARRT